MILFFGVFPFPINPADKKPLPKDHPLVKAIKRYVADGRKSELIRALESVAENFERFSPGIRSDSQTYAKIAIDELNEDNYRSPYLETALSAVGKSFYENLIRDGKRK
ncbi:MAG: hypothetical protein AABX93_03855 [Nanoarchaeota archaeon]